MSSYDLIKINGDFGFSNKLRNYAINPVWIDEYKELWELISGGTETIGQTVYEHISNYVQNIRDIDTAGLHQLYSMAKELDVERIFSYDLSYPADLEELMNNLSVQKSYLITTGYVYNASTLKNIYSDSSLSSSVTSITPTQFSGWIETSGIITGRTGIEENVRFFTNSQIDTLTSTIVVFDDNYINNFIEPTIYKNLSANASIPLTSIQSGVALRYQGFMDDIYSDPASEWNAETSGAILTECTHILRNIVLKASYQRETLKTIAQKHAMIGSTRAIKKIIGEYIQRSFTKKSDWRLWIEPSGSTKPNSVNRAYKMEQILPTISIPDPYFYVDVIEYWDGTEYMNISAASELVNGITGYQNEQVITAQINLNGDYITGYVTSAIPQYGRGLCGFVVTGGNSRFWEGDSLTDSILISENTSAEISAFYANLGLSADFSTIWNLQKNLWNTYATSGLDRFAKIPDLTGTPLPQYAGLPTSAIPSNGWIEPPVSLSSLQYKYLGTISGDVPPANYKNQNYPTIAPQPNLWNLIEKTSLDLSNFIVRAVLPTLQTDTERLSTQVDSSGNLIDSWRFYNQEFIGYQTQYEQANNLNYNEEYNPEIDRDGPFHPDTLSAFIDISRSINIPLSSVSLTSDFINYGQTVFSGQMNPYYSHIEKGFALSATLPRIDKQLVRYANQIIALSGKEIYQYSFDQNQNHYMLYKNSDSFDEKGEMWVRLRNHPLPFPMSENISGALSGIDMQFQQVYSRGDLLNIKTMANGNCYDFGFYDNVGWMFGDISGEVSGNLSIFTLINKTLTIDGTPYDLYCPNIVNTKLNIPKDNWIGSYLFRDYIIFVYLDPNYNWTETIGTSGIAYIKFKHYNRYTYDWEPTPLEDATISNIKNNRNEFCVPFTESISPLASGNIWSMAVSDDLVTLAYESINTLSGNQDFINSITTIDLRKTQLGNTLNKIILEWTNFVDTDL